MLPCPVTPSLGVNTLNPLRLVLASGALLTLSIPAMSLPAAMSPDAKAVASRWEKLDQKCRGESGDKPSTMDACERRESVAAKMKPFGWCLGKNNQTTAEQDWHRCAKGSINLDGTEYVVKSAAVAPAIGGKGSYIEALKGTWASTGQTCKAAHDTDQSLFFNGLKLQGEESDCIVMDSKEAGNVVKLKLMCVSEGARMSSNEFIKFNADKTISFRYDTFRKCSG